MKNHKIEKSRCEKKKKYFSNFFFFISEIRLDWRYHWYKNLFFIISVYVLILLYLYKYNQQEMSTLMSMRQDIRMFSGEEIGFLKWYLGCKLSYADELEMEKLKHLLANIDLLDPKNVIPDRAIRPTSLTDNDLSMLLSRTLLERDLPIRTLPTDLAFIERPLPPQSTANRPLMENISIAHQVNYKGEEAVYAANDLEELFTIVSDEEQDTTHMTEDMKDLLFSISEEDRENEYYYDYYSSESYNENSQDFDSKEAELVLDTIVISEKVVVDEVYTLVESYSNEPQIEQIESQIVATKEITMKLESESESESYEKMVEILSIPAEPVPVPIAKYTDEEIGFFKWTLEQLQKKNTQITEEEKPLVLLLLDIVASYDINGDIPVNRVNPYLAHDIVTEQVITNPLEGDDDNNNNEISDWKIIFLFISVILFLLFFVFFL